MRKKLVLFVVILLLSQGNLMARQSSKKGPAGRIKEMRQAAAEKWEHIADELDLSEKQREEIKEKGHNNRREGLKYKNEIKLKVHDLKYEITKKEIDRKKIDELIDEISELQKKIMENRVDSLFDFKESLTDEQWDRVRDMGMMGRFGDFEE
ncbi:MAG: periplasmic heavy metal sensor [Elusimicrobiota bacterium]|nr:periplasmic heavy metal sensor [Elusimicrobiota bacterium]